MYLANQVNVREDDKHKYISKHSGVDRVVCFIQNDDPCRIASDLDIANTVLAVVHSAAAAAAV